MAQNSSTNPATGGNTTIVASTGDDQLSGGGGNDTINGLAGNDRLSGDAPLPGQWTYSVYDRQFIDGPNQTSLIGDGNSTLVGHGYVDDFNPQNLRNTLGGTSTSVDRNDFGIIYKSGLQLPSNGSYTFTTTSDDGSRIIIKNASGAEVFNLNNDDDQGATTVTKSVTLPAGTYTIELYFWENSGASVLSATIAGPSLPQADLATSPLITTPPPAPGHIDGDDSILGDAGNDTITGGGGRDRLFGGADSDSILGEAGQDFIEGGSGNDTLYGGADNDQLYGNAGYDSIYGGIGDDTIFGGADDDTLYGDAGNDRFGYVLGDVRSDNSPIEYVYGGGANNESITTDYDVMDLSIYGQTNGWASVVINYSSNPEDGTIRLYSGVPTSISNFLGSIRFDDIEKIIRCFTPGTMILTDRGEVAVEDLAAGDMVMTRDSGLQPLRWVGRQHMTPGRLGADPDLQPVRIAIGALGADGPKRTMLVSPQHRVLVTGARAELLFGEAEVLVPAKHLIGHADASRALPADGVTYIHILFDRHEIVQSDGIWSESFQPADRVLTAMDAEVRDEILKIFPALATDPDAYDCARPSLKSHEARVLFAG